MATLDFSAASSAVYFNNDALEKLAVQVVTDSDYDGTTGTATLQESIDGSNWHNIEDSSGNAVTITLAAASTSYMLKTGIAYGTKLRVLSAQGDATTGTASVYNNYKA